MIHIVSKDDYACAYSLDENSNIDVRKPYFYYGYEEKNYDGEWLFIVSQDGKRLITYTTTEIKEKNDDLNKLYSPISFLLTGMYMFFDENIKNNNNE